MSIRLILFDLDDTLFDTHHGAREALASSCALARRLHANLSEEQLRDAFYAVLYDTEERLAQGTLDLSPAAAPGIRDLYRLRWRQVLERCGVATAHEEALADDYLTTRRAHYRLYPEVEEILPELLARYEVVLLTNGLSDFQREKIASVMLERWLPRAYVSGEVGYWKPQPEIFRHVLAEHDCPPTAAVMVGDSLRHDIAGAAAVGLRTVWLRRHNQPPQPGIQPDATLTDLRPLPALLREWEGERSS